MRTEEELLAEISELHERINLLQETVDYLKDTLASREYTRFGFEVD